MIFTSCTPPSAGSTLSCPGLRYLIHQVGADTSQGDTDRQPARALDEAKLKSIAAAMKQAGVWNCPTELLNEGLAPASHWPELRYVSAEGRKRWRQSTGTRNIAAYLGTLDSAGTVAIGKRADLVLVNGSPLEQIENTRKIAGVMLGGRWLTRKELDHRLAVIESTLR